MRPDGKAYRPMARWVVEHIGRLYGVQPEYLWAKLPNCAAFRHPTRGKWFAALILELPREKLGLKGEGTCDVLNVKCDPVMRGPVVDGRQIFPAYHMKKEHWVSLILDEKLPTQTAEILLDMSYARIGGKG